MPSDILALFDLDHTLLPHDSDEQWIEFLLANGKLDRASFESANRDLVARYQRGEAGPIEFTEFYLSTLKPFTTDGTARRCTTRSCASASCRRFRWRRATSSPSTGSSGIS